MNVSDAIEIVRAGLGDWQVGELAVDAAYEGTDDFLVLYGSREALSGNVPELISLDTPIASVDKATGDVSFITRDEFRSRVASLRLAFTGPDDL